MGVPCVLLNYTIKKLNRIAKNANRKNDLLKSIIIGLTIAINLKYEKDNNNPRFNNTYS